MDRVNVHFEDVQEGDEIADWPPVERLQHEFAAIGFYLSSHPKYDSIGTNVQKQE